MYFFFFKTNVREPKLFCIIYLVGDMFTVYKRINIRVLTFSSLIVMTAAVKDGELTIKYNNENKQTGRGKMEENRVERQTPIWNKNKKAGRVSQEGYLSGWSAPSKLFLY